MKKLISFIKVPRNIYFSIVTMLTVVMGLISMSFAYVDNSNLDALKKLKEVDNRITCSDYENCEFYLAPHEAKDVTVYVMSNNDIDSSFKLYYTSDVDADVISETALDRVISSHDVYKYNLIAANFSDEDAVLKLNIASSYVDSNIIVDGKEVVEQ